MAQVTRRGFLRSAAAALGVAGTPLWAQGLAGDMQALRAIRVLSGEEAVRFRVGGWQLYCSLHGEPPPEPEGWVVVGASCYARGYS